MALLSIYLDMDGVLVSFTHASMSLYVEEPDIDAVDGWDMIPSVLTRQLGREVTSEEFWNKVSDQGQEFWASIPWYEWGRRLFELCAEFAPVVLMSTPTEDPDCSAGKIKWIQRHMPKDWHRRYALTPCKHHMAHEGALLIDDSDKNCELFREHGGQAVLFPQPWNAKRDHHMIDPDRSLTLDAIRQTLTDLK